MSTVPWRRTRRSRPAAGAVDAERSARRGAAGDRRLRSGPCPIETGTPTNPAALPAARPARRAGRDHGRRSAAGRCRSPTPAAAWSPSTPRCATAVGVFDVSHLGKATVTGPGAAAFVNGCLTADLARIGPGQAQYTLCCNDSGGVVDDLIAYLVVRRRGVPGPERGQHRRGGRGAAGRGAATGIEVVNRHRDFGVLAVQGPASAEVLARARPADRPGLHGLGRRASSAARPVRVCRTGYTGEHGYELLPAWDVAPAAVGRAGRRGRPRGGRPAGLGARDTLRTEMGYPLHGQDLCPEITPGAGQGRLGGRLAQAGVLRPGRAAGREGGRARPGRCAGLVALDRGVLRAAPSRCSARTDTVIGETTSGTFSPTLGKGIGLALIDTAAGVADGDEVAVDVRGRAAAGAGRQAAVRALARAVATDLPHRVAISRPNRIFGARIATR